MIDLELAMPKELGGPGGDKSNPEQLFAVDWSGCFHSALKRLAGQQKVDVTGSEITAKVGLGLDEGGFGIAATLLGSFPTLDAEQAKALMHAAHEVCPYSRATRGHIDAVLEVAG